MDERQRVAEELRRVREAVRERAVLAPVAPAPAPAVRDPQPIGREPEPPAPEPPSPPDGSAVNAAWETSRVEARGGVLGRLVRRLLAPVLEAQTAFNARQVRLDNELLSYVDRRFDATHQHYDRVLGLHSRHMDDIDQRHLILQEELVAHVHDLVKRIDLVLAEAERGRLSLEFALQEIRARLARLEDRLPPG
jgi:hypothetical protein